MFWVRSSLYAAWAAVSLGCGGSAAQEKAVLHRPTAAHHVIGSWSNWRGPQTWGLAPDVELPDAWPEDELSLVWEMPLGTGWSSPVVDQGRVFITDRQDGEERVLACDAATGQHLWEVRTPVDFDPHPVGRRHGNGPKATCAVSDGNVYSLGIAGMLQCIDAARGEVVWRIHLPAEFADPVPLASGAAFVNGTENVIVPIGAGQGAAVPLFGYTGSPTIAGDRLILEVGGPRGGTLMAFDKQTGEVIWKALEEDVAYSSPVVATIAGVEQVIAMTGPRVVGLRASDGELLWSHPFQIQYNESISTPAVAPPYVLVTGDSRPLTALRIAERDGQLEQRVAWQNRDLSSYLSSMVVFEDHVYGMNDGGEWACIRLSDGETVWRDGNHGYYCTPVVADRQIVGLNELGELFVLAADPSGFRELAQYEVADTPTWTSPALVDGRLFLRSGAGLRCFELAR